MGVEKVQFSHKQPKFGGYKMSRKLRKPFVGHPNAILFLRISRGGVFQQPGLFQTESVGLRQLLTTALRTELEATLLIGVLTTHHCHNGLLPLPVAPSQDADMARATQVPFRFAPDHRPGPTLLRHRQTKEPDSARPHLNRRAPPRLHLIDPRSDAQGNERVL